MRDRRAEPRWPSGARLLVGEEANDCVMHDVLVELGHEPVGHVAPRAPGAARRRPPCSANGGGSFLGRHCGGDRSGVRRQLRLRVEQVEAGEDARAEGGGGSERGGGGAPHRGAPPLGERVAEDAARAVAPELRDRLELPQRLGIQLREARLDGVVVPEQRAEDVVRRGRGAAVAGRSEQALGKGRRLTREMALSGARGVRGAQPEGAAGRGHGPGPRDGRAAPAPPW